MHEFITNAMRTQFDNVIVKIQIEVNFSRVSPVIDIDFIMTLSR